MEARGRSLGSTVDSIAAKSQSVYRLFERCSYFLGQCHWWFQSCQITWAGDTCYTPSPNHPA